MNKLIEGEKTADLKLFEMAKEKYVTAAKELAGLSNSDDIDFENVATLGEV